MIGQSNMNESLPDILLDLVYHQRKQIKQTSKFNYFEFDAMT